ncbi:MAG: TlpA family protein disulfide reductase [Candidatus Eremiobacteraeota bacterium]|nr:TlpA family protein disulfide reductase [Candidatus Eremiobacteraeota bacterium]
MSSLRRWTARGLDVLAVLIVLVALVRFVVLPRLHHGPVQAPPVLLATLDGGRFDLARRHGRLVFLDFWASWCDPCRASIPMVQHFRRTHPGVDVVSVDVGEPVALVRPFAAQFKMDDVALDPDQTVAHAFGVTGYPTVVAIDATGRVRASWVGFDPDIERAMGEVATSGR